MRKICILNQKGGVAKTTTAINLAAGLAIADKRVLLLDLDPQGQIATYFPIKELKKDMFEFLTNGADINECLAHIGKNFDMIVSKKNMREAEALLYKQVNGAAVLKKKLEGLKGYDYVIIDCPPSVGILTQNALYYCDEVIIPTTMEPLSVDSMKKLMRFIADFSKQTGHSARISKILPTLYDRRNKISTTILNELRNEYYQKVGEPIRINSKLREAPRSQRSIFMYAPSSPGAKDYKQLVDTILQDESLRKTRSDQAVAEVVAE